MSNELFSQPLDGCDAVQSRLSEAADSGAPLPAEIQNHLRGCADCASFAETWLAGPPAALALPVPAGDREENTALRERILDARAAANVVRFRRPSARPARLAAGVWLGRVAACAVLAGIALWLLDPRFSPVKEKSLPVAGPSVAQAVVRLEDQRREEEKILHSAVVQGGSHVQHAASWSMSSLEL